MQNGFHKYGPAEPVGRYLSVKKVLCTKKRRKKMAKNSRTLVPEAKEAMNRFKMEAANEVGVNLKQGYNGDITAKQAGSVGGQMVKKMIENAENSMKSNY